MAIMERIKIILAKEEKNGISLLQISKKTRVGYATIWRLANSDTEHIPNLSTLNKILTAYGKKSA